MARTRRFRPFYIPSWEVSHMLADLTEKEAKEITQQWIRRVVSECKLCPFAAKHAVRIVVSFEPWNGPSQFDLAKQEVEKLSQRDADAPFSSVLIVFPRHQGQMEPLYASLLKECKHLGSVAQMTGNKKRLVQAIPFESCHVNRGKLNEGLDLDGAVPPLMAMAPFHTIQLLRYSDFAKIPGQIREQIMQRNDEDAKDEGASERVALLESLFDDYCSPGVLPGSKDGAPSSKKPLESAKEVSGKEMSTTDSKDGNVAPPSSGEAEEPAVPKELTALGKRSKKSLRTVPQRKRHKK